MGRLFVILFLFHLATCHFRQYHNHDCGPEGHDHGHGWGHSWHRHQEETDFDKVARCVISADKKVQKSCKQNPVSRVKLLPGMSFYTLKYSLPEFSENNITVNIKHRVLSVTAEAQGVNTYKDLRIVPDIVMVANASWVVEKGVLSVLMPYKSPLDTENDLGCGDINESVINAPKLGNVEDWLRNLP